MGSGDGWQCGRGAGTRGGAGSPGHVARQVLLVWGLLWALPFTDRDAPAGEGAVVDGRRGGGAGRGMPFLPRAPAGTSTGLAPRPALWEHKAADGQVWEERVHVQVCYR